MSEEQKPRGNFKKWDKDELKELTVRAGAMVPPHKRSFFTNPELAKRAGRAGGMKSRKKKKNDQ